MATRATYLIAASNWCDHKVCFYIHNSNCPKGAAYYLWKMHLCKNDRSLFAGRFFRANDHAELTDAHKTHNDTEYRYTLEANGDLTAWHKSPNDKKWQTVYKGTWYDFVNKYRNFDAREKLYSFKCSQSSQEEIVMTINEMKALIKEKIEHITDALIDGEIKKARSIEADIIFFQSQIDHVLDINDYYIN